MTKQITCNLSLFHQVVWKRELMAALTVAIIAVPQGMAYALLAGLPAIYGLYAAFVPLLLYPLFGTSRHLSIGPVALISIIVYVGLSRYAEPMSEEYIKLALLTAFLAGLIQIALAFLRMGFLINFLSEPVLQGFTTAAAVIIILSQIGTLFGLSLSGSGTVIEIVVSMTEQFDRVNLLAFSVGVTGLILILLLKKWKRTFPAGILIVILGTLGCYIFGWNSHGLDIIQDVPKGLPMPRIDFISWQHIGQVIPLAFVVSLISFIESLAISKSISARHDDYVIHANRELFALGISKMIGSFFQAYPSSGSFTRSAINDEMKSKDGMASLIAAIFVGIILLLLTPLFYYLPKPLLAAIVISAVLSLIQPEYIKKLIQIDRKDFYVFLTTLLITLFFGIQLGVLAGIVLSIILILQFTSKPHYAVLGQLPGTESYRNITRYPDAIRNDDVLIIRYDQDIYFGNAPHFYENIMEEIEKHPDARIFIFNAGGVGRIDSTGISKIKTLIKKLKSRNIRFVLTHIRGPVRDNMNKNGLLDLVGPENIYLEIHDALAHVYTKTERGPISQSYSLQGLDQDKNSK